MREGAALIWALAVLQQRFADARALLESLRAARDQFPEGQAWYAYSEGLLSAETDDLRTALGSYRMAARVWERLAMVKLANEAAEDLARILITMGRSEEAVSILEGLPSKEDPCARASLMINRAEALVDAAAHNRMIGETRVAAALAEEQRATSACPDPHRRVIVAVDAARHALAVGDRPRADALVSGLRANPEGNDSLAKAWRDDVLGRWSLARGRAREALMSFDEQGVVARAAGLRDERIHAEVGAGEALLALGRRRDGIARLKTAQSLLERTLEGIPLTEGRGEFLSSHDEGVRHLVDALVDGGAVGEAFTVARIARVMEVSHAAKLDRLRTLSADERRRWDEALERYAHIRRAIEEEAMDDWKLPATALGRTRADREIRTEEAREALDSAYHLLVDRRASGLRLLPSPAPDELQIAFFPGTRDWLVFTRSRMRLRARRFHDDALDSSVTASAILEELSPELAIAPRVLILAFGRADRIDWHAVGWRGAPLVATHEVKFGLDLPGTPEEGRTSAIATSALVVANPTGDLRTAAAEGDWVTRSLGSGWRVTQLDGLAATRDALLRSLPEVGLFHYAGHVEMAGPSGSSSALILAGGQRVLFGDLLALQRLPSVVVLSACGAAATGPSNAGVAPTSMMGLAQAFLAAGARAVIAPTREVADVEAQAFMASLYRALTSRGLATLTDAFRRSAIEAVGKSSQSFRLVVR
jgi:hypothetical protein